MPNQPSRSQRWAEVIGAATSEFETAKASSDDPASAMSNLRDIQPDYQDWLDNLPDTPQKSALGEKPKTICDVDIESLADDSLSDWTSAC